MSSVPVLLVLLASCICAVHCNMDNWIVAATTREQALVVNCTTSDNPPLAVNQTYPPDDAIIVGWMLPSSDIVALNWTDERRNVSSDGEQFTINEFSAEDIGVYHCVYQDGNGQYYLVKWGINLRGPFFINIWNKYMWNFIIGVCSAAGFFALALAGYLVHHFRYIPHEEGEDQFSYPGSPIDAYRASSQRYAYTNDGIEMEDNIYDMPEMDLTLKKAPLEKNQSEPLPPPPGDIEHIQLQDMPSWGSDATSTNKRKNKKDPDNGGGILLVSNNPLVDMGDW